MKVMKLVIMMMILGQTANSAPEFNCWVEGRGAHFSKLELKINLGYGVSYLHAVANSGFRNMSEALYVGESYQWFEHYDKPKQKPILKFPIGTSVLAKFSLAKNSSGNSLSQGPISFSQEIHLKKDFVKQYKKNGDLTGTYLYIYQQGKQKYPFYCKNDMYPF